MGKRRKAFVLAVMLIALTALKTNAQKNNDTTKTQELSEVVVSATRKEKPPDDVGRSITVISSEKIQNSGVNSISELLNQQEGIYIPGAQQNPGSLSEIFLRGSNANQTVIMIDGIRISDPSSVDNAINLTELSLAGIERIEIVRGSHSTLYGSSAIGGVINIITKKASKPGIHGAAEISGGAFNPKGTLLTESAILSYRHKSGIYVLGELFNTSANGFNSTVDTIKNSSTYKTSNLSDAFKKTDVIGKIGYKTEKTDIYAGYKKSVQKNDIDKGAYQDDDNYVVDFYRNLFTYGASYKVNSKFCLTYAGGISDMIRKAVDDSSQIDFNGDKDKTYFESKYSGTLQNNELLANMNIKSLDIVAGGNVYKETMSAQTYYYNNSFGVYESRSNLDSLKINARTSSAFLHLDIGGNIVKDEFKAFSIGLGGRYLNHSTFGSAFTWEVNPSIKIKETGLLYISYTTGFNAPPPYRLYAPDKDFNSGITRGNKNLKPETSRSWEVGFKQRVNEHISYSIACFKTVVTNVIDYVYLWNKNQEEDSLTYSDFYGDTYINLGTQTTNGIEFSIQSKVTDKLLLSGNFSLINGNLAYNPASIDTSHTHNNHVQIFTTGNFLSKKSESINLTRRPSTANASLTWLPIKKLACSISTRFVGTRYDIYYDGTLGPFGALNRSLVKDYTLIDLSVRYEIIKRVVVSLRTENIFDTKYYEINGYATRGRGIYGSMRYSF